ncbi:carboxylating nicotinate-nucleotide diphosphorylase [Candidatus Albibeggiatoa sp. nov. NOAA]|uniref:carboxylating nicotinate-nucleotide diphosphorylase n=1 Tax=Candidatus Albibeggiatoa sp. nov. NOAA TaxID=3162724 RepID=UPI0032F6D9F8|nr:carboxylating nicotinate-nucleotide diphosphorylase [Thiotrichaceae bacterium]
MKNKAIAPLPNNINETVQYALEEDIGTGDITAQLVPEQQQATAQVITREDMTVCGVPWFEQTFKQLDPNIKINWSVEDGDEVTVNQTLCTLEGNARVLLTGERTALNFLQLLSATATQTQRYVQQIKHTNTAVLDTRKTVPHLRTAQKYAVTCGGGTNHRIGLFDAFLIKENHIMAAGSIQKAVTKAKEMANLPVQIEVEDIDEVQQALDAGADRLLLDNFDLDMLREAVQLVDGRAKLEASGGINLNTIQSIAETGVDFISVGAITKDIKAIDLSMRISHAA